MGGGKVHIKNISRGAMFKYPTRPKTVGGKSLEGIFPFTIQTS